MRRYQEIIASTKKFGDVDIAKGVEAQFQEAVKYYRDLIQQGKNYVPHFTKLRS